MSNGIEGLPFHMSEVTSAREGVVQTQERPGEELAVPCGLSVIGIVAILALTARYIPGAMRLFRGVGHRRGDKVGPERGDGQNPDRTQRF